MLPPLPCSGPVLRTVSPSRWLLLAGDDETARVAALREQAIKAGVDLDDDLAQIEAIVMAPKHEHGHRRTAMVAVHAVANGGQHLGGEVVGHPVDAGPQAELLMVLRRCLCQFSQAGHLPFRRRHHHHAEGQHEGEQGGGFHGREGKGFSGVGHSRTRRR
jgi:hypothetical protein